MKVLMISKALVVGAYHGKLREISKLGVDLTVIVPTRRGAQKLENAQADGYQLHVIPCRFSGTYHFYHYPHLDRILRSGHWDLIHVDEEPFNFATYHVFRNLNRRHHRTVFFTWQNLFKKYPFPFSHFERYVFGNATGAIAGNAEAVTILRRKGFQGHTAVIPQFGVDPVRYRREGATELRRRLGVESCFVAGFVGRIVREKGLDTLFRAVALLPADASLVLVGQGPHLAALRELASRLGLLNRVRWIPWVNSALIPDYMNACDALVLPSLTSGRWKEQLGHVLLEAMACETCVVGSNSGEIPNVIGDAGLIFHEGDERQLAFQLRRLMDEPSLRKSLARRGRERVLQHFTDAKIARDTADFYELVCSGRPTDTLSAVAGRSSNQ